MKFFFVMTRGRTGSTAVIDSLNKSKSIVAMQEPFISLVLTDEEKKIIRDRDRLRSVKTPRFDFWFVSKRKYSRILQKILGKKGIYNKYLKEMEMKSQESHASKAFGFKIISHHFDERPKLKELLLGRNYKAVYLTRNIPRQVISGMVAKLRGKYNAHDRENYSDEASYTIDIDEFKSLVEWETQAVTNDIAMLESSGFEFIQVRYEDFVHNPDAFFANIFDFLNIPAEKLPASSFSIMIKDLKQVVQNYQELEQCAEELGVVIE